MELTQNDLANLAGVQRQWLVAVERGAGNPTFETLLPVLRALDLELRVEPIASARQLKPRAATKERSTVPSSRTTGRQRVALADVLSRYETASRAPLAPRPDAKPT